MKKTWKYSAIALYGILTCAVLYLSIWLLRSEPIEVRIFPMAAWGFISFILSLKPKSKTPPE